MFDRISATYDFLNRLLSFGTDILWRRKVARFLPSHRGQHVLDLATGTADQILALLEQSNRVKTGVGMDLAEKMLEIGRRKIRKRRLSEVISLMVGDATAIPVDDCQFDAVTISFGIRNIGDVKKGLGEMYRVLKPGGRLLILEFSMPQNRFMRAVVLVYLRHLLPCLGALVSRDAHAYRYLNETIETFPSGEAFCDLLRAASFTGVVAHAVPLGLPMIYQGDRPDSITSQQNGCRRIPVLVRSRTGVEGGTTVFMMKTKMK
ncbi:MAG: bifunctional demethylmenaquinone methyltransferase/2-methoxy-6-polyprenyl-1,4-benzoquinol methylase UbiE [Deltaproteobacteria bacterium]|nr:bifunctional demethylmenaquinone methyltransferase/2-methoxy-6-polyprenyl-1,4-benzoquinol methylase UbiE [Deltaproteobacteria bacterium]